jgi:G3E family GTPase
MSEESIKLAVLEQKLLDFSNIVHKLDDAIQKLSEVNTNITRMLAVHDERIEQCNKSDSILIKMIDEIKKENIEDHQQVIKRIESIEDKVLEINKIKWMTAGCGALLVVLAAALSSLASGWWTPSEMQHHHRMQMESKMLD